MDTAGRVTGESLAMAVVEAVADAEGVDPTAMSPPLAAQIDPDALTAFVRSAAPGTVVEFSYRDWVVEVRAPGEVTLREP